MPAQVQSQSPSAQRHSLQADQGLPPPQRRLAMLCVLTSSTMCMLATSLVTVALPTIARDTGASEAASVWVVSAFQLAVAASILPFSGLGAMLGLRRVFIGGLAAFTVASLACAFCTALPWLVLLRFLQGLGAAAVICTTPAFFRRIYPLRLLGRALGLNALVVATAMAAGPVVGGFLVERVDWLWLFGLNVPVGLAGLALARRVLPPDGAAGGSYDLRGAASSAAGVVLLILAADQLRQPGGLPAAAALLAGAAACLWAFFRGQRTARAPLLPPDLLLRNRRLLLATVTSLLGNTGQGVSLVAMPFLLQLGYGYGPGETGLLLTAMPVAIMFAAPLSGGLADRGWSGPLTCAGLLTVALSLASFAAIDPATAGHADFAVRIFLCGLGFGLFQTPNNREFMESVEGAQAAHASGLLSFTRNMGLTLGATLVAGGMALFAGAAPPGNAAGAASQACLLAGAAAFLLASGTSALRFRAARNPKELP